MAPSSPTLCAAQVDGIHTTVMAADQDEDRDEESVDRGIVPEIEMEKVTPSPQPVNSAPVSIEEGLKGVFANRLT